MGWFDNLGTNLKIRIIGFYTIVFIVVLVALVVGTYFYLTGLPNFIKLAIYVACSGGLGGLAFSIYGFTKHLSDGSFKPDFVWWYILRPFIGILYGSFSFLLVAGGLMTLSGVSTEQISLSLYNTKTEMFYCALAFLAGFAERSFSLQLNELAEGIFKKFEKNKKPGP
jgi:membrane protease YdiL (CAAX protease family)